MANLGNWVKSFKNYKTKTARINILTCSLEGMHIDFSTHERGLINLLVLSPDEVREIVKSAIESGIYKP